MVSLTAAPNGKGVLITSVLDCTKWDAQAHHQFKNDVRIKNLLSDLPKSLENVELSTRKHAPGCYRLILTARADSIGLEEVEQVIEIHKAIASTITELKLDKEAESNQQQVESQNNEEPDEDLIDFDGKPDVKSIGEFIKEHLHKAYNELGAVMFLLNLIEISDAIDTASKD